jgi:hypothetical protein
LEYIVETRHALSLIGIRQLGPSPNQQFKIQRIYIQIMNSSACVVAVLESAIVTIVLL